MRSLPDYHDDLDDDELRHHHDRAVRGRRLPDLRGLCVGGQVCQGIAAIDHGTLVYAICDCVDETAVCGPDPALVCDTGPCPLGEACVTRLTNLGFECGCGTVF